MKEDKLRVYEVTDDWRYFAIASSRAEAITHAASKLGEAHYVFLKRRPKVRVVGEAETIPYRDGPGEFEELTPAEVIRRRVVHGVVFFCPVEHP